MPTIGKIRLERTEMAVQVPPKTGFDKWQDGINKAVGNVEWNSWDCEIQMVVNEYNRHLFGTAGYMPQIGSLSRQWYGSKPEPTILSGTRSQCK